MFLVAEDMGTPPGAIALRGATKFQTPAGWDTVYTPILNMIERPVAPMLVVRVETDWYAHETEFRYVLQAGEGITVEPSIPIGQVFFVPREAITMRHCTSEELRAIEESRQEFNRHKAAAIQKTWYGLSYSPHYLRQSRAKKEVVSARVSLIFVSYRRQDTQSATGRLCDKLQMHFGADQVFHDIESIEMLAPTSLRPSSRRSRAVLSCWS